VGLAGVLLVHSEATLDPGGACANVDLEYGDVNTSARLLEMGTFSEVNVGLAGVLSRGGDDAAEERSSCDEERLTEARDDWWNC
jgi:hypothetical protein